MTIFQFIGLLKDIYGKKLPDLDKIQDKGLLAVKIAQHYALRVDFLDEKVCRHLSKLFTKARAVKGKGYKKLLSDYVEDEWFLEFTHIEEKPLAAASIGQVHTAELKSGEKVVIKIIKSDFKENFLKDLKRLKRFLKIVLFFLPKLKKVFDPLAILNHIEDYTVKELDLRNEIEGQNTLKKIKEIYREKYDLERLKFPRMYNKLSNKSVLVAELIEGDTLDNMLTKNSIRYGELLMLFHLHGLFLFGEGCFHGDLHPGNLIYNDGDFYFLDTGAISSASKKIRRGLFYFFKALTRYNYRECAYCINEMAVEKIDAVKYKKYEVNFLELYKDFKGKTVSEVSLTKKMMNTIKLAVNSGMRFDDSMFPIIKSLMYLDGMVLRCNPQSNLIEHMKESLDNFEKIIFDKV